TRTRCRAGTTRARTACSTPPRITRSCRPTARRVMAGHKRRNRIVLRRWTAAVSRRRRTRAALPTVPPPRPADHEREGQEDMSRVGIASAMDIVGGTRLTAQPTGVQLHVTGVDFRDPTCDRGRPLDGVKISGDLTGQTGAGGKVFLAAGNGTYNLTVTKDGPDDWDKFTTQTISVTVDAAHPRPSVDVKLVLTEQTTQTLRYWATVVAQRELDFWKGQGTNQAAWDRLNQYYSCSRGSVWWYEKIVY